LYNNGNDNTTLGVKGQAAGAPCRGASSAQQMSSMLLNNSSSSS